MLDFGFGQMKVLDKVNQERAAAEKKNMIDRIEQAAARGREDALMTQVPRPQPPAGPRSRWSPETNNTTLLSDRSWDIRSKDIL